MAMTMEPKRPSTKPDCGRVQQSPTNSIFSSASASISSFGNSSDSMSKNEPERDEHNHNENKTPKKNHIQYDNNPFDLSYFISNNNSTAHTHNNSYEHFSNLSLDSGESFEMSKSESDQNEAQENVDNNTAGLRSLSDRIRVEIEKLVAKSAIAGDHRNRNRGGIDVVPSLDEAFLRNLFDVFYLANFKGFCFFVVIKDFI